MGQKFKANWTPRFVVSFPQQTLGWPICPHVFLFLFLFFMAGFLCSDAFPIYFCFPRGLKQPFYCAHPFVAENLGKDSLVAGLPLACLCRCFPDLHPCPFYMIQTCVFVLLAMSNPFLSNVKPILSWQSHSPFELMTCLWMNSWFSHHLC